MEKNIMLFVWFIKFGFLKHIGEYGVHDYIKEHFCPKYIPEEEFDEKEQILRDTPGPAGIKYALYIGGKVNGIFGSIVAMTALLLPVIAVAVALWLTYDILFGGSATVVTVPMVNGMHAAALGLIAAHLYKIVYFNKAKKKTLGIILPSALIFLFLPDIIGKKSEVLFPFYIAGIIIAGIISGVIHVRVQRYKEKHPSTKYIDPHSKKGIKLRDRQLREEAEALQKYRDDNTIELRRKQLEEEELAKKNKREQ